MRWWLRNLAIGGAVGFSVGLVVGGSLGRVCMRLLFLAREDTLGFETAMGAFVGDFTFGGTLAICVFGAVMGLMLGVFYVAIRALLPARRHWRQAAFVFCASGLMLGPIVRGNEEDFAFLPVTLSLLLMVGTVAVTAIPVPLLVDRFAPDRDRTPGAISYAVTGLALVGIAVFAAMAVSTAYSVPSNDSLVPTGQLAPVADSN